LDLEFFLGVFGDNEQFDFIRLLLDFNAGVFFFDNKVCFGEPG
jgi:hypothetical protein